MFLSICVKAIRICADVQVGLLVFILTLTPTVNAAESVWKGDFSTGDFSQYHYPGTSDVRFWSIPQYGRPVQYGNQGAEHVGDGSLLSLVATTERTVNGVYYPAGPTRGTSEYAAKFTVKNSRNGIESTNTDPSDCDGNRTKICTRRRTQLKMQATHADDYNAIPHMQETWIGFSHYLNDDWWTGGHGFGPVLFGIKHRDDSYKASGVFRLKIQNGAYAITHSWYPDLSPTDQGAKFDHDIDPWQYKMEYYGNYDGQPYPRSDYWPLGLRDFPDEADSVAALQSVNYGGWTDWVFHWISDHRGSADGGQGILEIWKREDSGPWVKVLNIEPKVTHRGDKNKEFDHGIGFNHPAGYGSIIGLYMDKNQTWDAPNNHVAYFANHKIFGADGSFADVSPDGSVPGDAITQIKPRPPVFVIQAK